MLFFGKELLKYSYCESEWYCCDFPMICLLHHYLGLVPQYSKMWLLLLLYKVVFHAEVSIGGVRNLQLQKGLVSRGEGGCVSNGI